MSSRVTNTTNHRLIFILAAVVLLIVVTGCNHTDDSWARIQESGVLRVGLDPTYPPFELADDTGVTGFDVDLAHDIADGLGVSPVFSYFGYDGLYDALLTRQVDVLISAMVVSPERTKDFVYSRSYYDAGQVLIVPDDTADIAGPDDLAGRRVAVELGALGHVEALALARSLPDVVVIPLGSADEALDAVVQNEADAAIVDSISGRLHLKNAEPDARTLHLLPEPVDSEPFAIVVRIEDEALLQQIDTELVRLETEGRLAELISQWLGP
ncbi:MAG: ABC transporter substrate-binding protein [Chloroflexota bacterium]